MKSIKNRSSLKHDQRIYTITSEGYVPSFNYKGIQCPVKVHPLKNVNHFPPPIRTLDNKLIYALPGGGSITPKRPQAPVIDFASNKFSGIYRRSL